MGLAPPQYLLTFELGWKNCSLNTGGQQVSLFQHGHDTCNCACTARGYKWQAIHSLHDSMAGSQFEFNLRLHSKLCAWCTMHA